jgi:hypothetical protein
MLICDATQLSDNDLATLSRTLIEAGCACLCCWGQDFERVHDLFDNQWIENGFDSETSETITTTWHAHDSIDEFIEYAVWFTEPTRTYLKECMSVVAIVIDDVDTSLKIQEVLMDPAEFYASRESDT